jgi:ATP-binding cassette subfamily B protein
VTSPGKAGPAGEPVPDTGPPAVWPTARMAVGLAWVASRWISMSLIGAGLVGAAAPVAVAWLTRAVVDGLVAGRPVDVLAGLAAALVTAGVLVAALPQSQQYLQAELGRRAGRASVERLHGAVGRLVGLRRFEDPRFLDRLRIATLGEYAPGQIVASGLSTVRSILTLAGFVMSLAVISPVMTMIVLLAAVPTFAAELLLARRRAGLIFHISPVERRELFYRELLTRTDAAQEVRLLPGACLRSGQERTRRNAPLIGGSCGCRVVWLCSARWSPVVACCGRYARPDRGRCRSAT